MEEFGQRFFFFYSSKVWPKCWRFINDNCPICAPVCNRKRECKEEAESASRISRGKRFFKQARERVQHEPMGGHLVIGGLFTSRMLGVMAVSELP